MVEIDGGRSAPTATFRPKPNSPGTSGASPTPGVFTVTVVLPGAPDGSWADSSQGDDTLTALSEDVWAFALVAYELISRQEPFLATPSGTRVDVNVVAMHNILLNGHRPSPWAATGPKYDDLWAILERCWRTDPEFRPTMDVVYASLSAILT